MPFLVPKRMKKREMDNISTELQFVEGHFDCSCHSPEHTFKLTFDPEDGELYLTPFLANWYPWYKRVYAAIKYVFGYKSKFGHFDEVVVDPNKRAQLFDIIEKFKKYHDNKF